MTITKRGWLAFLISIACVFALAIGMDAGATEPKPTTPTTTATAGANANADANARSSAVGIGVGGDSRASATGGNSVSTGGRSSASVGNVSGGNSVAAGGDGGQATQQQQQTANGGAGGNASQSQSADNAGNSQSLAVSSTYEDRLQAPSAFAPAVFASGPCAYGWSVGVSIPGGSVNGGKAKADPACDRREVARVLTPLKPSLALKVLCADPIVAAVASGDDCTLVEQPPATKPEPSPPSSTDCASVDEKIDRAFRKCQEK